MVGKIFGQRRKDAEPFPRAGKMQSNDSGGVLLWSLTTGTDPFGRFEKSDAKIIGLTPATGDTGDGSLHFRLPPAPTGTSMIFW